MLQHFPSFERVRVLDLSDRWGQFGSKLITQLGADIVLAESEEGHELRRAWPLAVSQAGEPISLYFWHFNAGKRSVIWDLETEEGRRRATGLIDAADIVLVGVDSYRDLLNHLPDACHRASVVCVSAYGFGYPASDSSDDLHLSAETGMAILSGYGAEDDSEPIFPPVEQAMHSAGLYAAIAAVTALRVRTGDEGHFFDVSAQAAAFQSTEQLFSHWVYRKEHLQRRGGGYATSFPTERWLIPSSDGGYIYAFGMMPRTQKEWNDLRVWMRREGRIEDLDDPEYDDVTLLRAPYPFEPPEAGKHAMAAVRRFIESMAAEPTYRESQAIKMSWARVYQPHNSLSEEQFQLRKFFIPTAWPGDHQTYLTQSLPFIIHGDDVVDRGNDILRPPLVGEHTDAVISEWIPA